MAERSDCKDMIGIYNIDDGWELVTHFDVASYDMTEISWSMDGRAICVRDTFLEYRLLFYAPDGALLHTFIVHSIHDHSFSHYITCVAI